MVQLTIVDKVNTAGSGSELVAVLPHWLFIEDIREAIFHLDWGLGGFGNAAKKSGIQVQASLAASVVLE